MIFKLITSFFILISSLDAKTNLYQILPGKYNIKLVATDTQESYPIDLKFIINDDGILTKGTVDYMTYDCKSTIGRSTNKQYKITFKEKMIFGYDTCSPSTYDILINDKKLFNPSSKDYIRFKMFDGEENVNIKLKSYTYKYTKYARYRIKNQIKNLDEILTSKNSSLIRDYISLTNNKRFKKKAQHKLHKLIAVENEKYNNIKKSKIINDYEVYISTYPGSGHVNKAKSKIAQIKKEQLIASYRKKNTAKSYYKAYKLSNDSMDMESILSFMKTLKQLDKFIVQKPDLKSNNLVVNKFIMFYRKEDSLSGYISAYSLSKNVSDLGAILKHSNSILELENFLKIYADNSYTDDAKEKLIKLYRKQNNFKGYLLAYKLMANSSDGKKALETAKTSLEKAKLEKAIFKNIASKESLIKSSINSVKATYSQDESSGNMLSKYSLYAKIYPEAEVEVKFVNSLPYTPKFGIYKVMLTFSCNVPRKEQVRSKWIGNKDTTNNVKTLNSVVLTLKPPYNKVSKVFNGKKTDFVYFQRGSAGGFTARWPSSSAYVKIDSVDVFLDNFIKDSDADLDVDFDRLTTFKRNISYSMKNIPNSYSKGLMVINSFSDLDTNRENSSSNHASNESSESPSQVQSSSTPSSKSSSNASSTRGTKSINNNGKINGVASYRVNCSGGSDYVIYYKNGTWNRGGSGNMGMKYKNYSKEEVANYLCR